MENTAVTSQPISTIMTSDIYKVTTKNSLKEVSNILHHRKIRHVPVVSDGNKLVGILSLTDVQRLSFEDSYSDDHDVDSSIANMLTVEQVMKHKPVTVSSTDPILKAAQILSEAEFHALPVVDKDELVGIVTTTDIIRFLVEKLK